ncbi:hypothetical protein Q4I32_000559 [Leishmania shawi]|uniref:Uncharacterized protein n=2 Tax=Leishmania guyanensis species complex TaxID=38579 RepID=A0A1E1IXU9_LEIGU|nr:hypothetical protein, unknown function [Leishmania guyanensis]
MTNRGEMESMLLSAPMGVASESLVSILCIEATYKTQQALNNALSVDAARNDGDNGVAVATEVLRKLPGTKLCVSPYTTIHSIRSFLQQQEAMASSSSSGRAGSDTRRQPNSKSLANAHFFAILRPPASSEDAKANETFLPLQNTSSLQDVLASALVLRCADDANVDVTEQTLPLVYMRECQYGLSASDFLLCALCAGLCGCCIGLCASGVATATTGSRHRKEQKKQDYQQQQYPAQQYPAQQYPAQQYPAQQYYGNTLAPPPYQDNYQGNAPGGQPYSYGAPPQQHQGNYPTAQPEYYNYSGRPEYEQPQQAQNPPAQYYYSPPPGEQSGGKYQNSSNTGCAAPL